MDVPQGKRYYDLVYEVDAKEIMTGLSETKFRSNQNMNRAMVAVAMCRLVRNPEVNYTKYLSDVEEDK